jgi:Family of unknown function (DUF6524)
METLGITGFLLRFGAALLLVLLTFNPSGHSYVHWFARHFPQITPLIALSGLLLLGGWIVFVRATIRSLGKGGVFLSLVIAAVLVWLVVSWGWIDLANAGALTWIALVITSIVLAVGMSWSHIRRRLSGQADVDEIESP